MFSLPWYKTSPGPHIGQVHTQKDIEVLEKDKAPGLNLCLEQFRQLSNDHIVSSQQ